MGAKLDDQSKAKIVESLKKRNKLRLLKPKKKGSMYGGSISKWQKVQFESFAY